MFLRSHIFWLLLLPNLSFPMQAWPRSAIRIFENTSFYNLAVASTSGDVFVGAANAIYQLSSSLELKGMAKTGPRLDSEICLSPSEQSTACKDLTLTNNRNTLLLVDAPTQCLISCGSVHFGICEIRNISDVGHLLYYENTHTFSQVVISTNPKEPAVAFVGGGIHQHHLFVGTSPGRHNVMPFSVRLFLTDANLSRQKAFTILDESSFPGDPGNYKHHFLLAFLMNDKGYFLFTRQEAPGAGERYRTYVARLCMLENPFLSHLEVPLACKQGAETFSVARAGFFGPLGAELAAQLPGRQSTVSGESALYIEFGSSLTSESSALCVFTLSQIDNTVEEIRKACYHGDGNKARTEYVHSVHCKLQSRPNFDLDCGADHLPHPIAGLQPILATSVLTHIFPRRITAIAVLTEEHLTIAFLGDRNGHITKVYVQGNEISDDGVMVYGLSSAVSRHMIFDSSWEHFYAMSETQVVRIPISVCDRWKSCTDCLESRDPHCGWCVLQGRCVRKVDCSSAEKANRWVWSYKRSCPSVLSVVPSNLSRQHPQKVELHVSALPYLFPNESLDCSILSHTVLADVRHDHIQCINHYPDNAAWPTTDHVRTELKVLYRNVVIVSTPFLIYDCPSFSQLHPFASCEACTTSRWECQWCISEHKCLHTGCGDGNVVFNANHLDKQENFRGLAACPRVKTMMSNSLQPVGQPVELQLQAFNLDRLKDQKFQCAVRVGSKEFISPAEVKVGHSALGASTLSCWFTFDYEEELAELEAPVNLRWQERPDRTVDMTSSINLTLYKCTIGRVDCSLCLAVKASLNCSWCGNPPHCLHKNSCQAGLNWSICPAPSIRSIEPTLGPMEGGTQLTVYGSNLGQKFEDVEIIFVAGVYCTPIRRLYNISTRVVCETSAKGLKDKGSVSITVTGKKTVTSTQLFTYKDPSLGSFWPREGPEAGGTLLTIRGHNLNIGNDVEVFLGKVACRVDTMTTESIVCETGMVAEPTMSSVTVQFGTKATRLLDQKFEYKANPIIYGIKPQVSFFSGGRNVSVEGERLNSVQHPIMAVRLLFPATARRPRSLLAHVDNTADMAEGKCSVKNATFMMCLTPNAKPVVPFEYNADVPAEVIFVLDGLHLSMANRARFTYLPDPTFNPLSRDANSPHNYKPGSPITAEGAGLDRAMQQDEVTAFLGDKECDIKTLTRTHLYCQPPAGLPPGKQHKFRVVMGNLKFDLGHVIYADEPVITFPLEAQIAAGVGSALLILAVVIIVVIYRRKSKRALRNYMKVQNQLENLEITVRDQCKKQFSDLMTEMEDLSSDLFVTGIPFLDYKTYLERIFFPGQRNPMGHDLEVPVGRKHTVEQGLQLLSNLLCSKPFLTTFIHTLEAQPRVTARDRGHVASLLTVALYDKLEYYTDILRTLVSDLVTHYVARNPKLMLRRTETVAEKMLTNWMSICLHGFLKERAGEPLFLLFRAIKQQVEKGPVDAILRKAKYSLNDTRLLGDDVDYHGMALNATVENSGEDGPTLVRVLDCDTISQVKEKILDQVYRNVPFSQRPQVDAVDLEWHSPTARHFTLSDEDRTSASQGCWKRINTLRHYEIQEGATMFLVPSSPENQMNPHPYRDMTVAACMESVSDEEDCVRKWHLVKGVEETDTMAMRKGSEQERGQGKVIAEIYLTRLLSMKGILQNFVDGLFSMVLNAHGSVPLAVKYFFDFLDEEAEKHGVADHETLHIWKTNSLPLRFWVNIIKNPQFVFDIQVSDIVDSALTVIAQTFMDSCTTVDQKLGRDSPINKLLYAREIPRYKKMVEKYFVDVRQMAPVSDQEMNTALTDEARNHGHELKPMVALHELYKYISKYYEQIITALEVDPIAQKMQLSYRLQQVAAALEHKVTDL